MKAHEAAWTGARTAAGLCAAYVTLHAVYAWIVVDFRFNPITTFIYCAFPLLSFPVFILIHKVRLEFGLQCVFAGGYWIAYSMLSWRACSANGYCGSVAGTVETTLRTKPGLAALGVVVFSAIALLLDKARPASKNWRSDRESCAKVKLVLSSKKSLKNPPTVGRLQGSDATSLDSRTWSLISLRLLNFPW